MQEILGKIFDLYKVPSSVLKFAPSVYIEKVMLMLSQFGTNPNIFSNDAERLLLLLAAAEEWQEYNIDSNSFLRIYLKTLEVDNSRTGFHGSYGEKLQFLYDREFSFNNNGEMHSSITQYIQRKYLDMGVSKFQKWRLKKILSDWTDSSVLSTVRKNLGISKETERLFAFYFCEKQKEFLKDFGTAQIVFTRQTGKKNDALEIVFIITYEPSVIKKDANIKRAFEHEYAHIQSGNCGEGIVIGRNGIIFEGINEALTENLVAIPKSYEPQRLALEALYETNPDFPFEKVLYAMYMGDREARLVFLSEIIKRYGFKGVSYAARMSFRGNLFGTKINNILDNILIDAQKAEVLFANPNNFKE